MPPYQFMLGLAEAHAGAPRVAAEAFRRAASTDDFPEAWVNLARLDLDLGDTTAAASDLSRAMRLGRQHPQVALAAATIYGELGQRDAAVGALADGLIAAPSLASDPTVRSRFAAELSDAVPAAIENLPPATGYLLALEAGQADVARRVAEALDPAGAAFADRVIDAWSGDLAAFQDVRQAGISRPLDAGAIALCRRIERVALDEQRGPSWSCDPMLHSATYIVVRVVEDLLGRPALPGPDASWHFQYVYRRADPFDLLVPDLLHLQGSW
jgi:tetratricopeptide (TPR) repeat protein